jgi:hypothetical protein
MRSKLGPWQGKMLVMGGRVTLINSSLTSVPLYMLSFYRLPVGVKEKLEKIRNNFLWDETEDKKEISLSKLADSMPAERSRWLRNLGFGEN